MREEFSREIEVALAAEEAWAKVTDVAQVVGWIPKLGAVQELAPMKSYRAVLEDRLGPFRLRADLDVEVGEIEPPRRISVRAAGEDRQVHSRIAVEALLELEAGEGEGGSKLRLSGAYEVTGRVAALGAGSIRKKGEAMLDEFVERARTALA